MKKIQINTSRISENGSGVLIMINDSYKDFLSNKIKASVIVKDKENTNLRNYGVGAQILTDLGVRKMILLSNSQKIAAGIKGFGLSVEKWEKI